MIKEEFTHYHEFIEGIVQNQYDELRFVNNEN